MPSSTSWAAASAASCFSLSASGFPIAQTGIYGREARIGTEEMEAATAPKTTRVDQLCINTIRTLSIDAIQKANSGHPGTPMALAPLAYVLWQRFLRFDPANPIWPNRDRFVLSAGH